MAGAKFCGLSQSFPKLADWAVHWQVTLPGSTGAGNVQTGGFILHNPVCIEPSFWCIRFAQYWVGSKLTDADAVTPGSVFDNRDREFDTRRPPPAKWGVCRFMS